MYGCYLAFVMLAPFIYMQHLHLSISHYTAFQAIIIASFAISSIFPATFAQRLGPRQTLQTAIGISTIGLLLMLVSHQAIVLTITMSLFAYYTRLYFRVLWKSFPK